ncbi:aspartate-semialdehyde dehydrogenase [Coxiella endosymbiont of Amblyomma americanum]|uniref:aspartate-semialdehyde dehydrogenase n=1 Tax=Coxiella endosymbiont of Amblyomma americanum TaxID=325775 RepID=UPI00057DB295|nr:aspartate-semialdehyde dehydrogenase [Coxiella endosymbiont of Amblyomma americanum]AJC50564.1 aspartate-semialdehyde dehydrogenase [Coxiella endosymbiont of Amblyomma americanum]AUJ58897.1 aspartate-semialdehyde dehydrogenase [Coxiella-like endosymbiont of Amblyomma americanum]
MYDIAVVGATGIIGETIIQLLYERTFPVREIYPVASKRSEGKNILFGTQKKKIYDLEKFDFSKVQFAFFSAGTEYSAKYAPHAAKKGCVVIDNTSCFRYDNNIPLIVPEVNASDLDNYCNRNIISNPNCSTIQLVIALKPIYDAVGIIRVDIATYQSVSGAGRKAVRELAEQTTHVLNNEPIEKPIVFPAQIAFNVLPHIDIFYENGYTREEMKMVWETQKIMSNPNLHINPTAVRVPSFFGHSEAVYIETVHPINLKEVKECLSKAQGVVVIDDNNSYPTAVTHTSNTNSVFIGRIRKDLFRTNGLNLWIVANNIRKGAALNSIQIAETLINQNLVPSFKNIKEH